MSSAPATPKVVFDCKVLLQALSSPRGHAGQCVRLALEQLVELIMSETIFAEVLDVASRERVVRKVQLDPKRVREYIVALRVYSTTINDVPSRFTYDRDPDDAHYINVALAADARLIVSRDNDLLDLMDHRSAAGSDFANRFPTLRILQPEKFLREIGSPEA